METLQFTFRQPDVVDPVTDADPTLPICPVLQLTTGADAHLHALVVGYTVR